MILEWTCGAVSNPHSYCGLGHQSNWVVAGVTPEVITPPLLEGALDFDWLLEAELDLDWLLEDSLDF